MSEYVLVAKFCEKTGYTEKAVRRKIENGRWTEGHHFRRAPDGHILIDMEVYRKWVEAASAPAWKPSKAQSA